MASLMGSSTMARKGLSSPAIAGRRGVRCFATLAGENCYKTLSLRPGATEKEVKKAFRKLALQYHPDVCKGSQCSVQFNQINQAYHMILDELRRPEQPAEQEQQYDDYADDSEWMGYEAAYVFSGGRPDSVYFY
ncbi:Chaperone protein DnaJ [Rhynchospora pubera]|uniref:Chaperone protein DnaJ n=1 Tax=Rhynchospora pubera TaxID=906938 RepID=A0AAV8CVD0_9POAL|nr:Chaperone protein DnaJ [Rhynchospora pubera]KAJ4798989.1 Chaperone protein DnaJ [Rhynchospora pubera]